MNGTKSNLNLASRPLRNRRFFFTLLGSAAVVFLAMAAGSTATYFKNRARTRTLRAEATRIEDLSQAARKETATWTEQSRAGSKLNKGRVDAVNAIIQKKGFSWVRLFSLLEEAMPGPCFISSMAPLQENDGRVDVRFKIVSPGLSDLLSLIQKLDAAGFKAISVKNELQTAGQLVSEISVSYERTF
jgi:hypothetical protein